jgi:type III secretory pathway component EscV
MTLVVAEEALLKLADVSAQPAGVLNSHPNAKLISLADVEKMNGAGATPRDRSEILVDLVIAAMTRRSAELIGFDVVQTLLRKLRSDYPELADQVSSTVATNRILEILRRLATEGAPLRPERVLFEAIVEWSPRLANAEEVVEYVREALSHQICHTLAGSERRLACYVVEPSLERSLHAAIQQSETGGTLALSASQSVMLLDRIAEIRAPLDPFAPRPAIVTSRELRRFLRNFLTSHGADYAVLAASEIPREFSIHPIGTLSLPSEQAEKFAKAA